MVTSPRSQPLRRPVLLIVDDDVDQLLLFRISAQRSNAYGEVITAEDATRAMSILFNGTLRSGMPAPKPDIVVTDLRMPAMDGIDLAKAVRASKDTRHVGMVVLTASVTPKMRDAALEAGCKAVLRKPDDIQSLTELFGSLPAICGWKTAPEPRTGHARSPAGQERAGAGEST